MAKAKAAGKLTEEDEKKVNDKVNKINASIVKDKEKLSKLIKKQ